MAEADPSLRSGFQLRAPASLTPAERFNFTTPYTLGQYLLMDYMSRKTRTIH
jgi:hypothetical protein